VQQTATNRAGQEAAAALGAPPEVQRVVGDTLDLLPSMSGGGLAPKPRTWPDPAPRTWDDFMDDAADRFEDSAGRPPLDVPCPPRPHVNPLSSGKLPPGARGSLNGKGLAEGWGHLSKHLPDGDRFPLTAKEMQDFVMNNIKGKEGLPRPNAAGQPGFGYPGVVRGKPLEAIIDPDGRWMSLRDPPAK
jgi:hypothetical protein